MPTFFHLICMWMTVFKTWAAAGESQRYETLKTLTLYTHMRTHFHLGEKWIRADTGQMLFPCTLFPSSFWRFKVIFFSVFPEESLTWKRSIIVFWLVAVAIPALYVEERSSWTISTRAIYWFWKYNIKFLTQFFVEYCCDHKNTLLIPDQTAYSLYLKMKRLAYCTRQIFCILSSWGHF